jgi:GNAT superfamily N-acetyltransferase
VDDGGADDSRSPGVVEWGPERLAELVRLCGAALPGESLGVDDLEMLCFGEPSPCTPSWRTATFASGDAAGAVVVSWSGVAAHLQLLVVDPTRRREGLARELVAAAESWAVARGATSLQVGGATPFYLFTGVDTRWTEALCLFEALGYVRTEVVLDLVCPTLQRGRRPGPPGVVVGRVGSDEQVAALRDFARREYPHWEAELLRAGESGTAVVALDAREGSSAVLGAAAHSVSRLGVVGPVAVAAGGRSRGIGSALVGAVLADLSTAGLAEAEIAWTSTVGFYAKACGAKVGRAAQIHRRDLVAPAQD